MTKPSIWIRKLKPWQAASLRVLVLLLVVAAVLGGVRIDQSIRSKPATIRTDASKGTSASSVPKTSTPAQPTAAQPSPSASSSTAGPTESAVATPSPSTAQLDAEKCAYFSSEMQPPSVTALQDDYNAAVERVNTDVQTYDATSAPTSSELSSVNDDIQTLNSSLQADYQELLTSIQTYANTYGCSITLTAEPTLPSFNPPAAWNP